MSTAGQRNLHEVQHHNRCCTLSLFFYHPCMYTQTSDVYCVGCHYKMHVTYGSGNAQAARGIFMAEVNTSFSTAIPNRSADMGSQHVEPPCE